MVFGEKMFGFSKLAGRTYQKVNGNFMHMYTFPVFTYIFERPDNGKLVVESDGTLCYEDKQYVLPFTSESVETLKRSLQEKYDALFHAVKKKQDIYSGEWEATRLKGEDLDSNIRHLEELNRDDFTENRAASIRQLSKALRKQRRKLKTLGEKVREQEQRMNDFKEEHLESVRHLERQLTQAN